MNTGQHNSAKADKVTDWGFYILVGLMAVSLIAAVGYLIYSLLA